MTKRSINEMQDLMGFRSAITAAHSTYLALQNGGMVVPPGEEGKINRLPSVRRSISRSERRWTWHCGRLAKRPKVANRDY